MPHLCHNLSKKEAQSSVAEIAGILANLVLGQNSKSTVEEACAFFQTRRQCERHKKSFPNRLISVITRQRRSAVTRCGLSCDVLMSPSSPYGAYPRGGLVNNQGSIICIIFFLEWHLAKKAIRQNIIEKIKNI